MIKKKSLSAEEVEIWENYTEDPSDIYDKEKSESPNSSRKERFKFDFCNNFFSVGNGKRNGTKFLD